MKVELVGGQDNFPVDVVVDVLSLLGEVRPEVEVALGMLAPLEVSLVYDWAMREYLHASDHGVHRRPCPACLELAILAVKLRSLPDLGSEAGREILRDALQPSLKNIQPAFRRIYFDLGTRGSFGRRTSVP